MYFMFFFLLLLVLVSVGYFTLSWGFSFISAF